MTVRIPAALLSAATTIADADAPTALSQMCVRDGVLMAASSDTVMRTAKLDVPAGELRYELAEVAEVAGPATINGESLSLTGSTGEAAKAELSEQWPDVTPVFNRPEIASFEADIAALLDLAKGDIVNLAVSTDNATVSRSDLAASAITGAGSMSVSADLLSGALSVLDEGSVRVSLASSGALVISGSCGKVATDLAVATQS